QLFKPLLIAIGPRLHDVVKIRRVRQLANMCDQDPVSAPSHWTAPLSSKPKLSSLFGLSLTRRSPNLPRRLGNQLQLSPLIVLRHRVAHEHGCEPALWAT